MRKVLFITIAILAAACANRRAEREGRSVFRYNEASGISSLDPGFAKDLPNIWATNQLYNGLVQLNEKLEVEPCIASLWEVSTDGMEYTFHLRSDVCFHNHPVFEGGVGRKVVAGDFVFSFQRIVDEKVASPGAWVFGHVEQKEGQWSFFAPDDSTLIIRLHQPFTPFPGLLCMQYCAVVPKEAINFYGNDFRSHPVGTGPFQFKYWKEGVKLVMVKNQQYFEKEGTLSLPFVDAVAVTFLIDKQSAFLEFVKGNLDFLSGIDPGYKDELLTGTGALNPKYADRFNLLTMPYLNTEYLGFLVDTNGSGNRMDPILDKWVRQAINMGFDRKKMMRYLRNNIGIPGIYGIIPPGMPSFDSGAIRGYRYDPDRARQLLIEAGYPNGEGLGEITVSTTSDYVDVCKYIQSQLSELGITLKIDVIPAATIRELKAQAKLPFFRASWIADYPDAENYLSLFYSNNFCPSGPNYTRFSNERFDLLYETALRESNDSLRYNYYREMDQMIINEAPLVVLYYDQVLRFVQKDIEGIGINPVNLLSLKRVKKLQSTSRLF
jgi:peptide/nickel transport system substrate-binding protein